MKSPKAINFQKAYARGPETDMKLSSSTYKNDPSFRLAVKVFLAVFSIWMTASFTLLHYAGDRLFKMHVVQPVHVTLPTPSLSWASIQAPASTQRVA